MTSADATDPLRKAVIARQEDMWGWQEHIGTWREMRTWKAHMLDHLVVTRDAWPAGSSVLLELNHRELPESLFFQGDVRVRRVKADKWECQTGISPPMAPGPYVCHMGGGEREFGGEPPLTYFMRIDGLEPGIHEFELIGELKPRHGPSRPEVISCRTRIAAADEHVLKPVNSGAIETALRCGLQRFPTQRRRTAARSPFPVEFDLTAFKATLSMLDSQCCMMGDDIAFDFEIRDGAKVLASGQWGRRADWWGDQRLIASYWCDGYEDLLLVNAEKPHLMELPKEILDRLTVHLRGNEALSARPLKARTFWCGDTSFPFTALPERPY